MSREDVIFRSHGETCAGWFYTAETGTAAATVVMAHGLAGIKEMRLDAYAERFAAAGYHVLVFDYRHFGQSTGTPRQLLDIKRQHQDWLAAVDYARSRAEVDAGRIVLWGSSLSGGHVMAVAATVRPMAVVAQVPHTSGVSSVLEGGARQALRLAGHGLLDLARSLLRREPHYLPATGAPGEAALMTAPEATEYLGLVPSPTRGRVCRARPRPRLVRRRPTHLPPIDRPAGRFSPLTPPTPSPGSGATPSANSSAGSYRNDDPGPTPASSNASTPAGTSNEPAIVDGLSPTAHPKKRW